MPRLLCVIVGLCCIQQVIFAADPPDVVTGVPALPNYNLAVAEEKLDNIDATPAAVADTESKKPDTMIKDEPLVKPDKKPEMMSSELQLKPHDHHEHDEEESSAEPEPSVKPDVVIKPDIMLKPDIMEKPEASAEPEPSSQPIVESTSAEPTTKKTFIMKITTKSPLLAAMMPSSSTTASDMLEIEELPQADQAFNHEAAQPEPKPEPEIKKPESTTQENKKPIENKPTPMTETNMKPMEKEPMKKPVEEQIKPEKPVKVVESKPNKHTDHDDDDEYQHDAPSPAAEPEPEPEPEDDHKTTIKTGVVNVPVTSKPTEQSHKPGSSSQLASNNSKSPPTQSSASYLTSPTLIVAVVLAMLGSRLC